MKRTLRRAVSIATAVAAVAAGLGVMAGPAAAVDADPITGHPGTTGPRPTTAQQVRPW
ncbi:hypothetical protein OG730_00095 [Streptomyces sp. NBC_01298]|uniref:hypothetical protein n=1 Tax=Streptomyces sp. NBC_01298 TaxID=2903817 RepID=UPI002E0EA798|nr:hypothetical protein OG730_00095 [Streptomyces sp. NBC_01298]